MKHPTKTRLQLLTAALLVVGIVVILNVVVHFVHARLDLTSDKEFTLSSSTKNILNKLEDQLTIKLYYSKNIPAQLNPIKERVSDMLAELKAASRQSIVIETADPDSTEDKERETVALGLMPIQLNVIEKDRQEVKKVYMGMTLSYRDKKEIIPALTQVQNLEYILALNILKFTQKELPRIGVFIGAHNDRYKLVSEVIKQIGAPVPVAVGESELNKKNLNALLVLEPTDLVPEFWSQWNGLLQDGVNIIIMSGRVNVSDNFKAELMTTGIEAWLNDKGVNVTDALVIDVTQNIAASFQTGYMTVQMAYPFWVKATKKNLSAENPITAQLEEVVFPWTNGLEFLDMEKAEWKITPLVSSSSKAFLQPETEPVIDPYYVNSMKNLPVFGISPLSIEIEKTPDDTSPTDQKWGRVFLTATHHAVEDNFLQRSQSNVVFLANMLEYASLGDELIGIRSRGQTANPLKQISASQKALIKWGLMIGTPLLSIAVGLTGIWVMKKRRERFVGSILTPK